MSEPARSGESKETGNELRRRLASWDSIIIVVAVLWLIVAAAAVDNFGTSRNFTFLVLDLLPIALVALPMTFIVITGEIDLSVASTLGLTSALMGWMWNNGMAIQTIIPLCILIGAVLGAVNGFLITFGMTAIAMVLELLVALPLGYFLFRRRDFARAQASGPCKICGEIPRKTAPC